VIGLVAHREGAGPSWPDRVVAGCLAVGIVAGSGLMWIGVPVAGFWVAARITGESVSAVLFALLAIPLTMAAFGWVLYRAAARYEALRGGPERRRSPPAWRMSLGEERASERRRAGGRPLIDVAMTVSAGVAMLVLTIWFFFFAELRLSPFP
jgi:formate hydrogenlyase subunit 3/multisubunit Na+/H+ antiporter MnhD subunit